MKLGGDWNASDLAAGTDAGDDGFSGTDDDVLIPGGTSAIARIASILIKGSTSGTEAVDDHFGFVAAEIGAFRSAGVKLSLSSGAGNDLPGVTLGSSDDLRVREVVQGGPPHPPLLSSVIRGGG